MSDNKIYGIENPLDKVKTDYLKIQSGAEFSIEYGWETAKSEDEIGVSNRSFYNEMWDTAFAMGKAEGLFLVNETIRDQVKAAANTLDEVTADRDEQISRANGLVNTVAEREKDLREMARAFRELEAERDRNRELAERRLPFRIWRALDGWIYERKRRHEPA